MENFLLPSSNVFEEKASAFNNTKLAERLKKKYQPKPYEERFKAVYYLCLGSSYLCNLFSILTASTFVFTYLFSIVAELPYPIVWALIFTSSLLIFIEALQRILAPMMFRTTLQYGPRAGSLFTLAVILSLSSLSVLFSYKGGFSVVSTLSSDPVYNAPIFEDIAQIKAEYKPLLREAGAEAQDYKEAKLYRGRLSDKHAKVYKELLDKKNSLQNAMLAKISTSEERNRAKEGKAQAEHKEALRSHKSNLASTGGGLSNFAIIAQVVFFLTVFFMEFYDYKTATQYAITGHKEQAKIKQLPRVDTNTKTDREALSGRQIGFRLPVSKTDKSLLEQGLTAPQGTKQNTILIRDKRTVKHIDRKTGKTKYYTLGQVNNFIKTYERRVEEAQAEGKKSLPSRRETLQYWRGKKAELLKK